MIKVLMLGVKLENNDNYNSLERRGEEDVVSGVTTCWLDGRLGGQSESLSKV